jgi:hypothetical protein
MTSASSFHADRAVESGIAISHRNIAMLLCHTHSMRLTLALEANWSGFGRD